MATPHNDCVRIAQSDFSCQPVILRITLYKFDAVRLTPFKEKLCKMTENMQARRAQSR
jgi:hypothetical protein